MKNTSPQKQFWHYSNIGALFLWIFVFLFMGFWLGKLTATYINPWYINLDKSNLTPPDITFSIVWTILYVLIAISGWLLWTAATRTKSNFLIYLFFAQMLLNWAWTPLFFFYKLTGWALLDLIVLFSLNLLLLFQCFKNHRLAFWLLVPYTLWLGFAMYLNAVIWLFN